MSIYNKSTCKVQSKRKNEYTKLKFIENPTFKLLHRIRSRLLKAVKAARCNKSNGTLKLLGFIPADLKIYLEEQFTEGMTWDNQGKWHVDHIKPCAAFNLADPEEQKKCFHYTNLQPLWAIDNLKKGVK